MSLSFNLINHSNSTEIEVSGNALSNQDFDGLNELVSELIENQKVNIILNLKGVKILNSLGINTLIKIFTKCRNNGGELYVVNISEKINQVLLLTKLNTVLNIAPSAEDAVNKF